MPSLTPAVVPPGTLSWSAQPSIPADGLLLRPWRPADRPAVLAGYADPAVQQWHCRSMTDEEAADWLASWPARWREESGAGWAIVHEDAVVGQISLRRIDLHEGLTEVSYWVLPHHRGSGLAPRALSALAAWCFEAVGLHRIVLCHSVRNEPSCRVAARAGFALEGVKRAEARHPDGWHDMHLHARLASD
ncbi:GNAT family N-acetyltransferase [Dactylosporangium sucinum]|uniref:Acetyltransferase n=1 Tax=Dactylosporangium sucinum TaxID=1424081 RepID=A0A917U1D1_9ACTN|nr:GNAT family N-acetyltransferase [Dactylosporangium sucinum]GGM50536.1 acetyltransferase [Dactylosporangium sucinum]